MQFFRETRMKLAIKPLSALLKQLMETRKSKYLVKGFRGTGLWLLHEDTAQGKLTDGAGLLNHHLIRNFVWLS